MSNLQTESVIPDPFIERLNYISHGIGLLFILITAPLLLIKAASISTLAIYGIICFIIGLGSMFATSTGYHFAHDPIIKLRWKKADHICIYLAIAGSYTPFMILYLWDSSGPKMLILLAILVVGGVIFKLYTTGRFNYLSTAMYVLMGLSVLWVSGEFFPVISFKIKWLLIVGGISYLVGVIFYLRTSWRFHHPVWHLFVMGGALSHWWAVWFAIS